MSLLTFDIVEMSDFHDHCLEMYYPSSSEIQTSINPLPKFKKTQINNKVGEPVTSENILKNFSFIHIHLALTILILSDVIKSTKIKPSDMPACYAPGSCDFVPLIMQSVSTEL